MKEIKAALELLLKQALYKSAPNSADEFAFQQALDSLQEIPAPVGKKKDQSIE